MLWGVLCALTLGNREVRSSLCTFESSGFDDNISAQGHSTAAAHQTGVLGQHGGERRSAQAMVHGYGHS